MISRTAAVVPLLPGSESGCFGFPKLCVHIYHYLRNSYPLALSIIWFSIFYFYGILRYYILQGVLESRETSAGEEEIKSQSQWCE